MEGLIQQRWTVSDTYLVNRSEIDIRDRGPLHITFDPPALLVAGKRYAAEVERVGEIIFGRVVELVPDKLSRRSRRRWRSRGGRYTTRVIGEGRLVVEG